MEEKRGIESFLTVKWPWVLGGIFMLFAWLFGMSYANGIKHLQDLKDHEKRITVVEEQTKQYRENIADIRENVKRIREDQDTFLKEFYKRIK